ncbi:MAG: condensation domain-containing protein [Firmicutes bacterium]|nr:condensation domain-containing protein [Bacillota bacterium]MCM1394476.1 condensation domain-containing protein [[Eubacterium] siraeum]
MKKTKIKAEMWDRMQFLFRTFYDRMIHLKLYYDGKIDEETLKEAAAFMINRAPVLHSSFKSNPIKPYWKVEDYVIEDAVCFYKSENAEKDSDEFLSQVIPYGNNVQIKIAVFEEGEKSVLALLVNHMCMDGGDCRYFATKLCENYNLLKRGEGAALNIKSGSRGFEQVYSKFSGDDLKAARGLYKNVSKNRDKVPFPWAKPSNSDKNRIVRREIDKDRFDRLKQVAKALGITVNDAIMSIAVRTLYEICDVGDNSPLTVSCAIDLRRHIVEGGNLGGLTNHTAWLACRTTSKGESMRDTVLNVANEMCKHKQDKFMGLYSLPLLKLGYTIFPQGLAEFAIKIGYDNPLLAVSNIGLLGDDKLALDDAKLTGGFMSGATKYKPYFLMSATTLLERLTFSASMRGSDEDVKIIERYFDVIEKNLAEFNDINAE